MMLNLRYRINRNVFRTDAPLTFELHIDVYRRGIDANRGATNGWRIPMQSKRKKVAREAFSIRAADASTKDAGKVRVGGYAPKLPLVRPIPDDVRDSGKVRVGGYSPKL
jgi:hypothetical protein